MIFRRTYFSFTIIFTLAFGSGQVSAMTYAQYAQMYLLFQAASLANGCGGFFQKTFCCKEIEVKYERNGPHAPWREAAISKEAEQNKEKCAKDFKMHLSTFTHPGFFCTKNCKGNSKGRKLIGADCYCTCFFDAKTKKTTLCKAIIHSELNGINCCDTLRIRYVPENKVSETEKDMCYQVDNGPKPNKFDLDTKKKMNNPKKAMMRKYVHKTARKR